MVLSVNSESVESENHEVTDAEQQRRKTPDEVCGEQIWCDVAKKISITIAIAVGILLKTQNAAWKMGTNFSP